MGMTVERFPSTYLARDIEPNVRGLRCGAIIKPHLGF